MVTSVVPLSQFARSVICQMLLLLQPLIDTTYSIIQPGVVPFSTANSQQTAQDAFRIALGL